MSPTFGISSLGKECIIDEGLKEIPPLRYANIAINILLWVGTTVYLVKRHLDLRNDLKGMSARRRQVGVALSYLNYFFVALMVNNALRSSHMVDHICRPVYYHEPKWAYAKIWITELELPTYANLLMALSIWQGAGTVLNMTAHWNRQGLVKGMAFMTLYVLGSLFNLVHYTIEPPSNYGPFPNFNIAGTILTTLPVVVMLVKIFLELPQKKTEQLIQERPEGSATRASNRKRAPVDRLSY